MKKLSSILVIALIVFNAASVKSQNKISEGKAVFSIEFPEGIPDQYKAMMPTETTIYFKGDKSSSETKMSMMNVINIYDAKENTSISLMDGMGKKQAIKTDLGKAKAKAADYQIENTEETKTIAGYACKKAVASDEDGNKFEIWYTKDVQAHNAGTTQFKGIDGFPMQYEMPVPNMEGNMKLECKSLTAEKVSDDRFVIPAGYEIKTQEEMQKEYKDK